MSKPQRTAKTPKLPRNWLAVHAHNRKGGNHGDGRKEASRKACRGRVSW